MAQNLAQEEGIIMTLVPYRKLSLFDELADLFDNRAPVASASVTGWTPAVDIHEEKDKYVVKADIPGVEPKDIEITLENNVLTIKGERQSESSSEENGVKRTERFSGSFSRQFSLPNSIDADAIKANGKNGVLSIEIPKAAQAQTKRIAVH